MIITDTFFQPECPPRQLCKKKEKKRKSYAWEEADKEPDGKERTTEFNKVQQGRKDCTSSE